MTGSWFQDKCKKLQKILKRLPFFIKDTIGGSPGEPLVGREDVLLISKISKYYNPSAMPKSPAALYSLKNSAPRSSIGINETVI
jgi:hypothetical protein